MFNLNGVEQIRVKEFIEKHKGCCCKDAMCQKFEYRFYPGGIGTNIIIKCLICKEEEDVTDIDCW